MMLQILVVQSTLARKLRKQTHKKWIKEQGGNTNQGDSSKFTMMTHCRRKEAAALLCEAVQGVCQILTNSYKFLWIPTDSTGRADDGD